MRRVIFLVFFLCFSTVAFANPEGKDVERSPDGMEALRGLDQDGEGSGPGVDWGDDLKQAEQKMALEDALQKAGGMLGQAEADNLTKLMQDSNLTMEDRLTLVLTEIMKAMDGKIEEQADKVQAMQQGDPATVHAGEEAPSLDRETAKLERLTDARSQVFNTIKRVIERYDETSRGAIQSLRDGGSGPAPAGGSGGSPVVIPVASDTSAVKGSFSEAAGLESEVNPIEYRTGSEDARSKEPASRSQVPAVVQKRN